jgi:hypothetical protein
VNPQKYLGTWNYDQPDLATMRNVAVISCPPDGNGCASSPLPLPLNIPQIGNIVFSAAADGMVVGRTDQGCTWTFAVATDSLELSPPAQYCFNHNIGSSYTLTHWLVTVVGDQERETIVGVSHQPTGDLVTTMHYGARTRVTGVGGFRAMARFLGVWTYDPASPQTLVNMVVTVPSGAGGGMAAISPLQGVVWFTSQRYGAVVAHTADGCRWTLAVQGNTAELDPATQTCHLATGTVALFFWSAASDGEHENSVMAGVKDLNGQASAFYLYIGALTKPEQPSRRFTAAAGHGRGVGLPGGLREGRPRRQLDHPVGRVGPEAIPARQPTKERLEIGGIVGEVALALHGAGLVDDGEGLPGRNARR